MRPLAKNITMAMTIVFSLVTIANSASAASFGSEPLDDILSAAANNLTGTGLSSNDLGSIMLAPTWAETTGADTSKVPSPMTVGRADVNTANGTKLWADGVVSPTYQYVRAHWSAGVGVWQLDSAGMGANMSFHNAVLTNTASAVVASEIARLYKNASGTAVDKRRAAWGPWYGCGSSKTICENIYNSIYYPSTDIISLSRDYSVARGGGLVSRMCWNVNNPSVQWDCYKYDASVAQGYKGSWYYSPFNGASSLEPVPLPFFTYWKLDGFGNKTEYRHWLVADTGYNTGKWGARPFGTNARNSVNWYSNSELGAGW